MSLYYEEKAGVRRGEWKDAWNGKVGICCALLGLLLKTETSQ